MISGVSSATADPFATADAAITSTAASNAAISDADNADFTVAGDRFALNAVMQDDLAETARDQIADPNSRSVQAASRAHVFTHAKHEREAWLKLVNAEHASHTAHTKAKRVVESAHADAPAAIHHRFAGNGVTLHTTADAAAAIAAGEHQIPVVDGARLTYPSQDLSMIESTDPTQPGQTHGLTKHTGKSLADNVARLRAEPHIRAAGGYFDTAAAQSATDHTIANPANQRFINDFLADPGRTKAALRRVDLGSDVGASTMRKDLGAGRPSLVPGRTATVVLIKDGSFPEGYRTLTTYPDAQRAAEVDAEGNRIR